MFYESLGEDLKGGGLPRTLKRLRAVLRERHPGILIIDSFKALAAYASDPPRLSKLPVRVGRRCQRCGRLNSFWLGEYDLDTISGEPEAAVADSILGLGYRQSGERSSRLFEVISSAVATIASPPARIPHQRGGLRRLPSAGRYRRRLELPPRCRPYQRISMPLMTCSPTATGPVHQRSAQVHQTSKDPHGIAPHRRRAAWASPGSSPASRKIRPSSRASRASRSARRSIDSVTMMYRFTGRPLRR